MEENGGGNLFELFCGMIEAFDPCMDDYLYVFDVQNDQYYISKKAMKRFALPSFQFTHVLDTHRKFVYEEDVEMLEADLEKVMSGEKAGTQPYLSLDECGWGTNLDQLQGQDHYWSRRKAAVFGWLYQ